MKRKKSKNKYWNDKELCRKESLKYKNITGLQKNCWSVQLFKNKRMVR
jgi:hypothetical protein